MKTYLIYFVFSIFFSFAAYLNEKALDAYKDVNRLEESPKHTFSFWYGWVDCKGNKRFFVQENYFVSNERNSYTALFFKANLQCKELFKKHCHTAQMVHLKKSANFESVEALNLAKTVILGNKQDVLKVVIWTKKNTLIDG